MAANLLDTLQGYLTPQLIQHAAAFLDERPSATQKAIEGAVPALIAGMIERSGSAAGTDTLLTVINRVGHGVDLAELSRGYGLLDDLVESGRDVLATLFGGRMSAVAEQVASLSGLRLLSATSLIALLAPVVLGAVGREMSSKGLGAAGLISLLAAQRADVTRFLPAGLSGLFAGVTGLVSDGSAAAAKLEMRASHASDATSPGPSMPPSMPPWDGGSEGRRWAVPVVVLGVLSLGLWWLLHDPRPEELRVQAAEPAVTAVQQSAAATQKAIARDVRAVADIVLPTRPSKPSKPSKPAEVPEPSEPVVPMASVTLPTGVSLDLPEHSVTYEFARYFEGAGESDLPRAFVFDRLHFHPGSTRVTQDSRPTIDHLAEILKAYPSAVVRLEGHTDNRGPAEKNKALSERRAAAIQAMLEGAGVPPERLSAAGFGADNPIASNDTADGRQKNRRIEVVVTQR